MVVLKLLLFGGLAAWARRRYVGGPESPASPDGSGDLSGDGAPDAQAPTDIETEIRATDADVALSAVGLAAGGATALGAPLIAVAVPCVALPLAFMGQQSWREGRAHGRLTLAGLETLGGMLALATGHVLIAALGQTVFLCGQRLMLATRRRNRLEVRDAFGGWVDEVWVLRDGVEVRVPLEALSVGDHIVVTGGQAVPCDGTLVEGVLTIDRRMLTGESMLAEVHPGDPVHAATMALGGRGVVVVAQTGRDTLTARLAQMLSRTISYEQTIEHEAQVIADQTVAPALAMGAAGFALGGLPGALAGVWSNCVEISWLNLPVAALALTRAATRSGILIKDGRSLDMLRAVDTVVFDKTGTLTRDTLHLVGVRPAPGVSADALLRAAAAAERKQSHPIAAAIVAAADEAGLDHAAVEVEDTAYHLGLGLSVVVDGRSVVLGSRRMLAQVGVEPPAEQGGAPESGLGQVWVAIDGRYAGLLEFEPDVRDEAAQLVAALHARGIEVAILTGDEEAPTRALAERLGIDRWSSRTLPEDKAAHIDGLRAAGRTVCFVGDGLNDTLAMHRAHVSVSLTGASAMAVDSAQIIMKDGNLTKLDALFDLAESHDRAGRRILGWTAGVSILAFGGVLYAGLGPVATLGTFTVGLAGASAVALTQRRWRPPALGAVADGEASGEAGEGQSAVKPA